MADEVELTVVTMDFRAADADRLMPVLSKYVVLSRGHDGCRNIDFCASVTRPGRFLIIEKWESPEAQRAHFDSDDMVGLMKAVTPEYRSDYNRSIFAEGEAKAIISVVESRGLALSPEARARITACTDLDQLDAWLRRVGSVSAVDALFD